MRNLYLYVFILLYGYTVMAQKNDHWQLGKPDLDFSTNPNIVNTISTIPANSNYGRASISDSNGDLLFYTDGMNVWNKNHTLMANGANISTWPEYIQNVLIVPHPGNGNKYFIFRTYVRLLTSGNPFEGSYYGYSIVDFTNNALGEITQIEGAEVYNTGFLRTNGITGDPLVHYENYCPLVCVKSYSGNFYWLIVQERNKMYSYKIDSNGINTPIVSTFSDYTIYNIGQTFGSTQVGITRSKFRMAFNGTISKLYGLQYSVLSPNSTDPIQHQHRFHSLDFNDSTGVFSNFQQISLLITNNIAVANNFELSPDLQKAYFVQYREPTYPQDVNNALEGQIIVKDLTNLTAPARLLYEFASPTTVSSGFYAIQKDKYDNMIVSSTSATNNKNQYIHIINDPDSFTASSVKLNYVSLNNNPISILPELIHNAIVQCQGMISLTTTETNVNYEYKSYATITTNTNYVVNSGSNIVLHAEDAIILDADTEIKNGSVFIAEIFDCPLGNGRTGNFNQEYAPEDTLEAVQRVTLYPNPNNGTFEIAIGTAPKGDVSVEVYDIYGKVIYRTVAKASTFAVDIPNLSAGVYLVKLSGTEVNESIKFIKQ